MKLGMHLSIAGGLPTSLEQPRPWAVRPCKSSCKVRAAGVRAPVPNPEIKSFLEKRRLHGIKLVVAHLSYFPNLAATDDLLYVRSWERFARTDFGKIPGA